MNDAAYNHLARAWYDLKPGGYLTVEEPDDSALQTKLESWLEAWINVFIGFWINFTANLLILPLFGFSNLTIGKNFLIGAAFTVISVARQYVIRRWAQKHLRAFKEKAVAYLLSLRKRYL